MKPIRVALVGLGGAAARIHLPALASVADVTLVGAAEPSPDVRSGMERWKIPVITPDLTSLLDRTHPDLVIVATPPDLHAAHVGEALESGAHVLCEKPFVSRLDQADALIALSARQGRLLAVNNQYRYMRIYSEAQRQIASGKLGELYQAQVWQQMFHPPEKETNWRAQLDRYTLFEFGTHVLDLLAFFFGDLPEAVTARTPKVPHGYASDVLAVVLLDFPGGRVATLNLHRVSRAPRRYLEMRLDTREASLRLSLGGVARAGLDLSGGRPRLRASLVKGGGGATRARRPVAGDRPVVAARVRFRDGPASPGGRREDPVGRRRDGERDPCARDPADRFRRLRDRGDRENDPARGLPPVSRPLRRLWWPVLVGIGLALRVGLFLASSADPARRMYSPDSFDYARLAENLRAGHGFSADPRPPFRPNVLRTPVYPGFLAILLALGGRLESAGVAAGVLLSCAAVWLTRWTARRWLADARAGRLASALVALDIGAAAYANFLLTESLFVVLIVLAFACLAPPPGNSASRTRAAFLAGLLVGASILCRPIALGLPIALAIGRPLRSAAVLLAGAALIVVPWVLRNQSAAGIFNVSSVADVNLFYHRGRAVRDAREGVEREAPKEIPGANDPLRVRRMRDEGWRVILDNPLSYARLTLVAWLRTFGPDDRPAALLLAIPSVPAPWWSAPAQASLRARRFSAAERILEGTFMVVLYLLAAGGWRGISDPVHKPLLLSAAGVVVYFLVVSGPEYYGRFRVPIVPFIALMAEAGRPARTSSEDSSAPRGTG